MVHICIVTKIPKLKGVYAPYIIFLLQDSYSCKNYIGKQNSKTFCLIHNLAKHFSYRNDECCNFMLPCFMRNV